VVGLPSSSIDTYLACSIMIILVLSAMAGETKILAPYLNDLSHQNDNERFQQLASHLLLSAGTPANWGQIIGATPDGLGLAKADSSLPYELDVDKITRLNSENDFSLPYSELWKSLGVHDVAFQIEVKTIFDLSIALISSTILENETRCVFSVTTKKSGMPVSTDLSGYALVNNFAVNVLSSTSSNGVGSIEVDIPNSESGPALLMVFAKAKVNPRMVSFSVYAFGFNSVSPLPNRTFAVLSPLNYVLNASLVNSNVEILNAQVFTFNYDSDLTEKAQGIQTLEYYIPRLADSSPMIIVLTGNNGSTSFAEWVTYPQLPIQVGANFNESIAGAKIISLSHVVTINHALYEVVTKWGGTA